MLILFLIIPCLALFSVLLFPQQAKYYSILCAIANVVLGVFALSSFEQYQMLANFQQFWDISWQALAKPTINFNLRLIDGMSLCLLLLSVVVCLVAVTVAKPAETNARLWYGSIWLTALGAIGSFLSADVLFLFAFHELALVPTFIMIYLYGNHHRSKKIAWQTMLYLVFGSLVLLAAILLSVYHVKEATFDIAELTKQTISGDIGKWIALLYLVGFGTLVSLFPLHSWATPSYAAAPTPIAILHAGVLKKFGLYGLIRLTLPLVPEGLQIWGKLLAVLLLCNIIWVGFVTINQRRLNFLLGSSSVMHMGYIFLAILVMIYAPLGSDTYVIANKAAVLLMVAHGLCIAMGFYLANLIRQRCKTLQMDCLSGLGSKMPKLFFCFGIMTMAAIGLPGLANFVGELLIFKSCFNLWQITTSSSVLITKSWILTVVIIAMWGIVISAVYGLRALHQLFFGENNNAAMAEQLVDISWQEKLPLYFLALLLLSIGLIPSYLLNLI